MFKKFVVFLIIFSFSGVDVLAEEVFDNNAEVLEKPIENIINESDVESKNIELIKPLEIIKDEEVDNSEEENDLSDNFDQDKKDEKEKEPENSRDDNQSQDSSIESMKDSLNLETDEMTGALIYNYPFNVPLGRKGLEPDLKLSYNSQDNNNANIFGYGWSINIPHITRIARKGVDKLYTEDYFQSSLDGELVNVSSGRNESANSGDSKLSNLKQIDPEVNNIIYSERTELIDKRNKNSKTYLIGHKKDGKEVYASKIYIGDVHYFDNLTNQFENIDTNLIISDDDQVIKKVENPIRTDEMVSSYSGSGDAYMSNYGCTSWSECHDAEISNNFYSGAIVAKIVESKRGGHYTFSITRGFLPFDTSFLGNNTLIESAELYLYNTGSHAQENDNEAYVTIVDASGVENNYPNDEDYGNISDNEAINSSERKYINYMTPDQYIPFSLNSAGIEFISRIGTTKLGVREGHDFENDPIAGLFQANYMHIY
ncbi:hypothetical protein K8R66_01695, partial [bacterium]|nr:hypothetical protein [bacterium]